jgi:hypothetical protein
MVVDDVARDHGRPAMADRVLVGYNRRVKENPTCRY